MVKEVGNNFFETEFGKYNSRECTLLLEFDQQSFSYSIFHTVSNTILYSAVSYSSIDFFAATKQQLLTLFKTESLFRFSYGKCLVLLDSFYSTLVPKPLYKKDLAARFLAASLSLPNVDLDYLQDDLKKIDYTQVYAVSKTFLAVLKNNFLNLDFWATESVYLDFLASQKTSDTSLNVHLSATKIHCVYFEENVLKFSNSFRYDTAEDLLYNIMNVYKQLGLNTLQVPLHISGLLPKESTTYDLLYKYIKTIHFLSRPVKLNFAKYIDDLPSYYFLEHYAALL